MAKLPSFLQSTASKRAGMVPDSSPEPRVNGATPAALSDDELWAQFRASRTAQELVVDVEKTLLEKRAALVEELNAVCDADQKRFRQESAKRAAAAKRRDDAERAFREALDAELKLGIPFGDFETHRASEIRRELEETADARILEFANWCQTEHGACRLIDPPFIAQHVGRDGETFSAGYDQDARDAILSRMLALSAAVEETRGLKLLALNPPDVLKRLRRLHAGIPSLTTDVDDASRRPKVPGFLEEASHP